MPTRNIPADVKRLRAGIGNAVLRRDHDAEVNLRRELAAIQLGRRIDAVLDAPGLTDGQRAALADRLTAGAPS